MSRLNLSRGFICALSFALSITIGSAQTFTPHTSLTLTNPGQLARADFNRDTITDVVATEAHGVAVVLMNADGTIKSVVSYPIAPCCTAELYAAVRSVTTGDFNNDGKPDIAVAEEASDETTLGLYLGNGDGTFQAPRRFDTPTYAATAIDAADFNGDGKLDVVLADMETSGGSSQIRSHIRIFHGDGAGGFDTTNIVEFADVGHLNGELNASIRQLSAGDFNGDHRPDVVFTITDVDQYPQVGSLYELVNNGSDQFTQRYLAKTKPSTGIAVSDVNQDGTSDVVLTYNQANGCTSTPCRGVTLYKAGWNGYFSSVAVGSFSNTSFYGPPAGPSVGDVNGDGFKDITVVSHITDTQNGTSYNALVLIPQLQSSWFPPSGQKIYKINSSGTYSAADSLTLDITRDGRLDIAATSANTVSVMINTMNIRPCYATDATRKIRVCKPIPSTVTSPVQIMAHTRDADQVNAMKIYIDGVSKFFTADDFLSTRLPFAPGDHRMTVKAWDRLGSFSETIYFAVSTGCVAPGIERTIKICSPVNGATVSSPVKIEATINDPGKIFAAQVYVDGVKKFEQSDIKYINTSQTLGIGNHWITVKVWDQLGQYSSTAYFTIQ